VRKTPKCQKYRSESTNNNCTSQLAGCSWTRCEALAGHRDAVILVGAQAVHLHCSDSESSGIAYTSDGDLALDPRRLKDEPLIESSMMNAGFLRGIGGQENPGIWSKKQVISGKEVPVEVDLLVPLEFSSGGRRSAKIPPHDSKAVLRVPGIEAAIVDHVFVLVRSLELERDQREVQIKVAGIPALLVAKAIKIRDRLESDRPGRLADKDAGDVLFLMSVSEIDRINSVLDHIMGSDPKVAEVVIEGLNCLRSQFGAPRAPGVEMAVRALAGVKDEGFVRALAPAFVEQLSAFRRSDWR
jgi:hypothetical protein